MAACSPQAFSHKPVARNLPMALQASSDNGPPTAQPAKRNAFKTFWSWARALVFEGAANDAAAVLGRPAPVLARGVGAMPSQVRPPPHERPPVQLPARPGAKCLPVGRGQHSAQFPDRFFLLAAARRIRTASAPWLRSGPLGAGAPGQQGMPLEGAGRRRRCSAAPPNANLASAGGRFLCGAWPCCRREANTMGLQRLHANPR
jgi:hypothetical protein